jgi:hypothetical protein
MTEYHVSAVDGHRPDLFPIKKADANWLNLDDGK